TDSVKFRKGQSTDSEAITTIYAGSTVNVIEQYASGWAKIEYNNKTGYVKSEFLKD
ncbi:MAG: SH3 domain-containing protein, partial [Butyrivibrio sp.]|nr:SH3 domain-containing protein [Butyrivibrio sp.]